MKFTEHEMVFFNSITKGDTIFGIPLHFRIKEKKSEEIKKTIRGLIEKQILKTDTELSELGVLPARALELYKQSKGYIIINYLHIALIDKQEAVVIIPLKNREYELLRLPRAALLYLLLEQYPVLRNGTEKIETKVEIVEYESFLSNLPSYDGNIMVGVFQDNQIVSEHVYYWKEAKIQRYDFNTQVKKQMNAPQVRKEIVKLFQMEAEVHNNVG